MFREALTYPVRGDHAEQPLLVGVICSLAVGLLARLGVLALLGLLPAILLVGYAVAVVRATAESDGSSSSLRSDAPPRFGDFGALAADGVRALVVAVGYLLVPAVALAVTIRGAAAGSGPADLGATVLLFGASTTVLVVSLAFAYLLPAALAGVARRRSVSEGFDRGRLRKFAGDGGYFVGWISALLVAGSSVVVLGSLAALGRPGEVAALALSFYALVAVSRLVGRSVR
ncbi:DUF4013 domain-containing protein [Halorussus ruber]|uniref:DUF4013 domain-containing protein n=1 Tax=Halorussus ruber TaxID=1126238 RepID=UPI00143D30BB|nr:DUF4013 domain-containing protein [Halorussus ruber]